VNTVQESRKERINWINWRYKRNKTITWINGIRERRKVGTEKEKAEKEIA
jgi:hypothetical protein